MMASRAPGAGLFSTRSLVGSSILVVENVLRLGMVAAVSLWIAHRLGPAQFGLLNHASALVSIFWAAAMLGMDTPLTARLTRDDRPGLAIGSAIALRLLTGLLSVVLAVAAVMLLRAGETDALVLTFIVALAVPLSAPFVVDAWFKSKNEALAPAVARLVATALSCTAKIACLLLGGGVVALAWTVALESALVAAALLVAYRRDIVGRLSLRLSVKRSQMQVLLRESWPFLLSTVALAAYMKIDVVMLGALSGNEQTGLYSLSQKLCEVSYIVPVIVADVLFPQLVRNHALHGSADGGAQAFFDLASAAALLCTLAATAFVVVALPALFGEPYRPTVEIFVIHVWACIGVALNHARYKWMAATNQQAWAPWVALLGLVVALILHAILIPAYGAKGAAAATVAAFFISGYLASYIFPPLRAAARMQTRALWPWFRLFEHYARWRAATRLAKRSI